MATSSDAAHADVDDVFFVALHYKGASYEVPVQSEEPVASIFDFVQEALDFPRENCKLIHRGKMLRPDHDDLTVGDAGLAAGAKLMLVASSSHDISFVQNSRADPLVKGFVEEERDEASRRKRARAAGASAWGTKQDPEYCFGSIKAEFKYHTPPPYDAERLLQRLATDPGIIEIMKTRRFKVGVLTEMSPQEAADRMAKRGTPNMDLLGYNMNSGDKIVLKLRTDNTKGFRPYSDLINTLIHELTHNVWGPHDNNFWKLYGELKAEYMRFHRFWSHNGRATDSGANEQFAGFGTGDEPSEGGAESGFGRVLGSTDAEGAQSDSAAARKARALKSIEERSLEQERATLIEEAKKVGQEPLPNFLSGDGTWKIMCPCGQIHDGPNCMLADGTPIDQLTAEVEEVPAQAAAEGAAAGAAEAEAAPAAVPTSMEEVLEEAPAQEALAEEAAPADTAANEATQLSKEAPAEAAPLEASAVEAPAPATELPAAEQPTSQVDMPALDRMELETIGLDGASVWIERFNGQLRAFCGTPVGATGLRPEARTALEMLLRLVRNIVGAPSEPKFRRIRADNPRIRAGLLGAGAEVERLMRLLGFEPDTEGGEQVYVIRDRTFDCARLRLGQELLEMELGPHGPATVQ